MNGVFFRENKIMVSSINQKSKKMMMAALMFLFLICFLLQSGETAFAEEVPLEVSKASFYKSGKIEIIFNKDLDTGYVLDKTNFDVHYSYSGTMYYPEIEAIAYETGESDKVVIQLEALAAMDYKANGIIEMDIMPQGVKDAEGNAYAGDTLYAENKISPYDVQSTVTMNGHNISGEDFIFYENQIGEFEATVDITLTVLDEDGGSPVQNLEIKILSSNASTTLHTATTNSSGTAVFNDVLLDSDFRILRMDNTLDQLMVIVPEGYAFVHGKINDYIRTTISAVYDETGKKNNGYQKKFKYMSLNNYYYILDKNTSALAYIIGDDSPATNPDNYRVVYYKKQLSLDDSETNTFTIDVKDRSLYTILSKDKEPDGSLLKAIESIEVSDADDYTNSFNFLPSSALDLAKNLQIWILNDNIYDTGNVVFTGTIDTDDKAYYVYLLPSEVQKGQATDIVFPSDADIEKIYSINQTIFPYGTADYDYVKVRFSRDSDTDIALEMQLRLYAYYPSFTGFEKKTIYHLAEEETDVKAKPYISTNIIADASHYYYFSQVWSDEIPVSPQIGGNLTLNIEKNSVIKGETQSFKFITTDGYELTKIVDFSYVEKPVSIMIKQGDTVIDTLNTKTWDTSDVNIGTYTAVITDAQGIPLDLDGSEVTFTVDAPVLPAPTNVTAAAGNGQATVSFTAPADDGGSPITGYIVTSAPGNITAVRTGSAIENIRTEGAITITGLTNGETYTFTVKAINAYGEGLESAPSNEVIPQMPAPGAPELYLDGVGDGEVALHWRSQSGAKSYSVYQGTQSGHYTDVRTVAGITCTITGLENGKTYYFAVTANNPGGESGYSDEISAIPITAPGAPTHVSAVAGRGEATVTFTAPETNGGSAIIKYIVISSPGNITAEGAASPITITGLTNGTTYHFKVKAVNQAGNSAASVASNAVRPTRPSKDRDRDSDSDRSRKSKGIEILVNGEKQTAATATTTKKDDRTVTIVTVDDKKIEEKLKAEGNHATVTIPVEEASDVVVGQLNGQIVKKMASQKAIFEIKTSHATYTLPAEEIDIAAVSEQIGSQVELTHISVEVSLAEPTEDTVKVIEDTANTGNYQIVAKPVEFEITCTSDNKTVEVSRFNAYVERTIAILDGIDSAKITTGIVLNEDGTFSHVPTTIVKTDGKYYAKIRSLTNSIYSVIYSPKTFSDAEKHWAKKDINDMGSRLVISGVGKDKFEPNRDITRAEFAAVITKGLGLMRSGAGRDIFTDVTKDAWYYDVATIANEYNIISGYGNGQFGPMDKVTREQAMTMIARAMLITGPETNDSGKEKDRLLDVFNDSDQVAAWAEDAVSDCIRAEIISGKDKKRIAPDDNMTRAEAAAVIRRLLLKSGLI